MIFRFGVCPRFFFSSIAILVMIAIATITVTKIQKALELSKWYMPTIFATVGTKFAFFTDDLWAREKINSQKVN